VAGSFVGGAFATLRQIKGCLSARDDNRRFLYVVSPKTAHRLVGYFEEEAVVSYTHYLAEIDEGRTANVPAPAIALRYWNLPADATLRDVVLVVRQDEAHHRDVNHGFANTLVGLPQGDVTPSPVHVELVPQWKTAG